jgi:hypothetical protein
MKCSVVDKKLLFLNVVPLCVATNIMFFSFHLVAFLSLQLYIHNALLEQGQCSDAVAEQLLFSLLSCHGSTPYETCTLAACVP